MKWVWHVPSDRACTITFDVNILTGGKKLAVTGQQVPVESSAFATRLRHSFPVGAKTATITYVLRGFLIPQAELDIDGVVLAPAEAPPRPPVWVWLFAVANLAMLVVSKGGAIVGAIAGAGAVACVLSTMTRTSAVMRLLFCVGITAAAWGLFYGLVRVAT